MPMFAEPDKEVIFKLSVFMSLEVAFAEVY